MKRIIRILSILMAAVLCLGLLAACGSKDEEEESKKSKLVGTWSYKEEEDGMTGEMKWTFKSGGKGEMKIILDGEEWNSMDFTWKVDSKDVLTLTPEEGDGDTKTLEWSKDAKDGDEECWYISGKTLYIAGEKFTKK